MTHPTDDGPVLKPSDEARRLVEALEAAAMAVAESVGGRTPSQLQMNYFTKHASAAVRAYLEATPQNAVEAKPVTWNAPAEAFKWNGPDDAVLPEDAEIEAAHPMRSGDHKRFTEALRLVGAKRSKYALVGLVNWLLSRAAPPHADLVAENARLRKALKCIASGKGVCGTCGTQASGEGLGYTDCDCSYPVWTEQDQQAVARAALTNGGKNVGD